MSTKPLGHKYTWMEWTRISGFSKFIQILIVFIPSETTSCQVPNNQRVGLQFKQNNVSLLSIVLMLLISHQGQKPKSSDLAAMAQKIDSISDKTNDSKVQLRDSKLAWICTQHQLANLPHKCDALISVFSFCFKALRYRAMVKWLHCLQGNPRSWHPARRVTLSPHLGRKTQLISPVD